MLTIHQTDWKAVKASPSNPILGHFSPQMHGHKSPIFQLLVVIAK